MFSHHKSMLFALTSVPFVAGLIAATAFAKADTAAGTASAPAAPSSPTVVHYHYHFHQHGSAPNQQYTGYTGANTMGSMAPYATTPTQSQPYPAGYLPGPFAPTGFQNLVPGAPPAQGVIHVFLPTSDAVVYVNGQQMRGKGKDRKFTTPVLQSNQEYQYWVTATFKQGGESVTQYRKVIVGAGEYNVADFTRPPEQNPIRLPAGPVDPNSVVPPTPE